MLRAIVFLKFLLEQLQNEKPYDKSIKLCQQIQKIPNYLSKKEVMMHKSEYQT